MAAIGERSAIDPPLPALIAHLLAGLPLTPRPYQTLGMAVGMEEAAVLSQIEAWLADGTLSRFGVVVRHEALGFCANAMVVWDIPDRQVDAVGERWRGQAGISLCYRRPRRPPRWPYNLFTMIHGRDRSAVTARVAALATGLAQEAALAAVPHAILFTGRRFKQTAPHYGGVAAVSALAAAPSVPACPLTL